MAIVERKTGRSVPAALLLGSAGSLAVTVAATAIGAALINGEMLGRERSGVMAVVIQLLGAILGAALASALAGRIRMQVCLLHGACYFCLLLAGTALLFGGQYEALGTAAGAVLIGSLAAALPAVRQGRGRRSRVRNRRSR